MSFFPGAPCGVEVRASERPFFVTARDAFDTVECPECGESIERFGGDDDQNEWWEEDFLDKTYYAKAPDLDEEISMPCCGASVKLGHIDLGSSACLTSFVMSLSDPEDASPLSSSQMSALEEALGCRLSQIMSVRS
ncbi:MAG: hypothetical protein LBD67_07670 [Candidatus Accumulibacter sp.]|nr:hypothetical protein [Accumulibacter sp.]